MRDRIRRRTKYLTVSAMLAALGVIILMLGSLVDVLDVTVAVLASLLGIYAVIEMGGAYPWLIWIVTSVLSMVLLPQKTPALFYACFAGFYPIVKEKLEKLKRPIALLLKIVVFHLCLGALVVMMRLFLPDLLDMEGLRWLPAVLYALCFVTFLLYDFALTQLITYYLVKLRKRFGMK